MRAELTIEIERTPEDVFAYLSDVSNLPAWQAGVKTATQRDGRIEESRTIFGRELHTTLEIVDQEAHGFSRSARSTVRSPSRSVTSSSRQPAEPG